MTLTLREAHAALDRFVVERPPKRLGDLVGVAQWLGSIDVEAKEVHQVVTVDIDLQEVAHRFAISVGREVWFDEVDGEMLDIELGAPAPAAMRPGYWRFSATPDGFPRWREDHRVPDEMYESLARFLEQHGLADVPAEDVRAA